MIKKFQNSFRIITLFVCVIFSGKVFSQEVFNNDLMSFEEVEKAPVFSECFDIKDNCERKSCVDSKIRKALDVYLNDQLENDKQFLIDVVRPKIRFVIDTTGTITKLDVEGGNKIVNSSIRKAISELPKMNPAEDHSLMVNVVYEKSFFLKRNMKEDKSKSLDQQYYIRVRTDLGQGDEGIGSSDITPFGFSRCKKSMKNIDRYKKCISDHIKKYINKKFNVEIAEELGLSGHSTIYVRFRVSNCGGIVDVQARGLHPRLEKEAIRVVRKLSRFVTGPGKYNQQPISVHYSLPIGLFVSD